MRRTILAILAMLGLIIGGAQMASAHSYFIYDESGQVDYSKHWRYDYPVITVSDRSGYDLNEYEAAYSWGSLAADSISLAYTQADTCTWCIRIVTAYAGGGIANAEQYLISDNLGRVVASQCTIHVDPMIANYPSATYRQSVITHEIGHCLGFEHAPVPVVSVMLNSSSTDPYKPTSADYALLDEHYSY